ncbi:glycosyltransferase family 4 protein [Arenibaculum pallidiluteum]|uniref:glycosyltransferase family 4 protein n=1 Tax=Arenibaculum pallidiluteum TaxID=2812559 RepID=UPI001A96D1E8|nr:glycosyltransferase family 4 protein [Arenibaculum pallidiluteum]
MRILFHHRIASRDGQSVHMDELIAALRRRGHAVMVTGPEQIEEAEFGADAGWVDRLKALLPRPVYELLELGYNIVAYRRLRRAFREFRPDFVYERYNLFTLAGVWLARSAGVPLLSEVNAPLCEERARHSGGLALRRLAAWTERAAWRGADRVLPVTDVLADYVRRAGVPDARIAVIPNGIDPARFARAPGRDEAKRRLGLEGRTVLGFTGFLRAWHALDRALDLVEQDAALHLLVVGDGPGRAPLEAEAARRGLAGRVTVTGIVGRDVVADHIAAFDIALQPGVTPYASPLKLFEYMALGCAILAPDTRNIREILKHGRDALLFEPSAPEGFGAALRRLCEDPELRAQLGAGARRTIEERDLTWDRNADRVLGLAAEALAERTARRTGALVQPAE